MTPSRQALHESALLVRSAPHQFSSIHLSEPTTTGRESSQTLQRSQQSLTQSKRKLGILQQAISASCAASVTTLIVTPFDVVKARLQVQHGTSMSVKNMLTSIWQVDGLRGLYRGLLPSIMMQIPSSGFYYGMYEWFKRSIENQYISHGHDSAAPWFAPLLAGCTARVAAVIISNPFEYLRTAIQASSRSAMEGVNRYAHARELLFGSKNRMFTGVGATILRDAPFSAIYWTGYENLKRYVEPLFASDESLRPAHGQLPFFSRLTSPATAVHFICGASSGMTAALLTHPIDVVKTRIQAQYNRQAGAAAAAAVSQPQHVPYTIRSCLQEILQEEGPRGLLKGLTPRLFRVAPSCAIMISSYELFKDMWLSSERSAAAAVATTTPQSSSGNSLVLLEHKAKE